MPDAFFGLLNLSWVPSLGARSSCAHPYRPWEEYHDIFTIVLGFSLFPLHITAKGNEALDCKWICMLWAYGAKRISWWLCMERESPCRGLLSEVVLVCRDGKDSLIDNFGCCWTNPIKIVSQGIFSDFKISMWCKVDINSSSTPTPGFTQVSSKFLTYKVGTEASV